MTLALLFTLYVTATLHCSVNLCKAVKGTRSAQWAMAATVTFSSDKTKLVVFHCNVMLGQQYNVFAI